MFACLYVEFTSLSSTIWLSKQENFWSTTLLPAKWKIKFQMIRSCSHSFKDTARKAHIQFETIVIGWKLGNIIFANSRKTIAIIEGL